MGSTRAALLAVAVLVITAAGLGACGGDDCEGGCECRGDECVCPFEEDCLIDCVGDCDLQCAGSGACDFTCSDGCLISCTGSGPCIADVGDDSVVECTGSGGCEVFCHGDCLVDCPGSGACLARCDPDPGFGCDFDRCSGEVIECPDDILVCNGGCPDRRRSTMTVQDLYSRPKELGILTQAEDAAPISEGASLRSD